MLWWYLLVVLMSLNQTSFTFQGSDADSRALEQGGRSILCQFVTMQLCQLWHTWEISMACKEQQLKVLKNQREACQKLILAAQCSGLEEWGVFVSMQCVFHLFCGRLCRCVIFVGEPLRTLRGGAMRQPATQHCIHKPKMSGANLPLQNPERSCKDEVKL